MGAPKCIIGHAADGFPRPESDRMTAELREATKWAYRLLLRREPENEDAIESHARVNSIEELRQNFVGSPEFLQFNDRRVAS